MSAESKEEKEKEGCCDPKEFQGMFEMMSKCVKGEGGFDCLSIKKAMKNQSCCGPEENIKSGC